MDSTSRQRRVTEDCKTRERPKQFYVFSKTKQVGARLEQSRKKRNIPGTIQTRNAEGLTQGKRMKEKLERWKTHFKFTKSQPFGIFIMKDVQGSTKTDQELLLIRTKDACINNTSYWLIPFLKLKHKNK